MLPKESRLQTPIAFVASVYAQYHDGARSLKKGRIYTPRLLALLKGADAKSQLTNNTVLDYDPLCQCQDAAQLKAAPKLINFSRSAATVAVDVRSGSGPITQVKLSPFIVGQQWRINDISFPNVPSLVKYLS